MNLSRIVNCGFIFFNKIHQSSVVGSMLTVKNLNLKPSVSFLSYNPPGYFGSIKLTPTYYTPLIFSSRGMKVRANLQLRCKNCYFVRKDGIMYVMCSSYPRHKQVQMTKRPKYTWILTSASQSVDWYIKCLNSFFAIRVALFNSPLCFVSSTAPFQ